MCPRIYLMPNHVHLIAVPETELSLAQGIGWAHQAYTRRINFRENWRGYLWQGRFFSCPLDEAHAQRALRYVELNPVRAKLTERAEDWPWSSAGSHATGEADGWTVRPPFVEDSEAWKVLLRSGAPAEELEELRTFTRTGRPLGAAGFVERLEHRLGRVLKRKKPGPAPKVKVKSRPRKVK